MARSAWVLLLAAIVAAGALVWWRLGTPTGGEAPVATAVIAPKPQAAAPSPAPSPAAAPSTSAVAPSPAAVAPAPPAVMIEEAAEPKTPAAPSFDVVRVAPSGSAVIAGRAAPGIEVTVKDGANEVGRAVADPRGEWVVLPKEALAPGTHALVIESANGARSDEVAVLVPEKAHKSEQPLAVLLPKDAPARPLQGSPVAPPGTLALDAVEYDAKGEVVVGGQAKPGAEVHVYLGGAAIGTATADEKGRWTTKPAKAIDPGLYTLRADEVLPDGRIAARVSVPFRRAVVTAGGPGDQIVVQPGDNLWNIARQTYGSGPRYAIIYAANQTDIRDPDLIYPGQVFKLPAN